MNWIIFRGFYLPSLHSVSLCATQRRSTQNRKPFCPRLKKSIHEQYCSWGRIIFGDAELLVALLSGTIFDGTARNLSKGFAAIFGPCGCWVGIGIDLTVTFDRPEADSVLFMTDSGSHGCLLGNFRFTPTLLTVSAIDFRRNSLFGFQAHGRQMSRV